MTTTVPLIYSFAGYEGVADAVADHVITAQNMTLYNTLDKDQIAKLKQAAQRPSLTSEASSASILGMPSPRPSFSRNGLSVNAAAGNGSSEERSLLGRKRKRRKTRKDFVKRRKKKKNGGRRRIKKMKNGGNEEKEFKEQEREMRKCRRNVEM